ncbi:MAG: hypothetical protein AAF485_30915, partial [Chloroflexota bacterium]
QVDDQQLTFQFVDGGFQDEETSSRWSLAGVAIDGPLSGTELTPLPSRSTFWVSLITTFTELELYTGDS